MSSDSMDPRDERVDETVTRLLRELYAAPAESAYWAALEASIMSRVAGERGGAGSWWAVVAGWVPAGVAAAAVACLVAGLALMQERAAERQLAFEQAMRESAPASVQSVVRPSSMSDRDATLQLVLSP